MDLGKNRSGQLESKKAEVWMVIIQDQQNAIVLGNSVGHVQMASYLGQCCVRPLSEELAHFERCRVLPWLVRRVEPCAAYRAHSFDSGARIAHYLGAEREPRNHDRLLRKDAGARVSMNVLDAEGREPVHGECHWTGRPSIGPALGGPDRFEMEAVLPVPEAPFG